jgi:hypothetical protein
LNPESQEYSVKAPVEGKTGPGPKEEIPRHWYKSIGWQKPSVRCEDM